MNETLNYIESYFENGLTAAERTLFERRITDDAAFAGEVAFYLQARQVLRQELVQQKEKSWKAVSAEENTGKDSKVIPISSMQMPSQKPSQQRAETPGEKLVVPMKRPSLVRRITAVAAAVVIMGGVSISLIFNSTNSLQRQAGEMVKEEMAQIGGEMGDTEANAMVRGIEAYNTADYTTAATIFDSLHAASPDNLELLEYSGQAALQLNHYDTAISRFKQLATHTEIRNNPGTLYEALAVIQRKQEGYKEEARRLLNIVVQEKQKGWPDAAKLLKIMK